MLDRGGGEIEEKQLVSSSWWKSATTVDGKWDSKEVLALI